jgi:hypothetical protein
VAYLNLACRLSILGVFLVATVTKTRSRAERQNVRTMVQATRLLPQRLVRPVTAILLVSEAVVVVLLATPWYRVGFALAALLLVVFIAGTALMLNQGKRVACACFGSSNKPLSAIHLYRDSLLLLGALAGLLVPAHGHLELAGLVAVVLLSVAAVYVVVGLADFASLFVKPAASQAAAQRRGIAR